MPGFGFDFFRNNPLFSMSLWLCGKFQLASKSKIAHLWRWLLVASLLSGLLPACSVNAGLPNPSSAFSGWKPADLRLLQAPGSDPVHSLIALYSRETNFDLEIRLDFLDLSGPLDFDVYLALDTQTGGSANAPISAKPGFAFDVWLKIPASSVPQAFDARMQPMADLRPRSASDPSLDMMTIQLNRANLPGNPSGVGIQVFVTLAGQPDPLTQTPPVYPTAAHPARAPLLLVFWNTLPAATPAQILRRWDGAHTGPYGGRHGLNVLLNAAASQQVPLFLADLTQPASLSALSAVGGLSRVRQSAYRGDVVLPESAVGDPLLSNLSLAASRQTAQSGQFPTSPIAFGALKDPLPDQYSSFFADLPDRSHILGWQNKRLIPLPASVYSATPAEADPQVDYSGLTLNSRLALLTAALSPDPGDLVVLGGSLPESAWGEFSITPAAFEYIAAHPWIKPLNEASLNEFPATDINHWPLNESCHDLLCSPQAQVVIPVSESGLPYPAGGTSETIRLAIRMQLKNLPPGPLTQLALQSYFALSQPTDSPSLEVLQANALGYVSYLIEAALWDASPYTQSGCSQDLDFDGEPECILASPSWFVVLKTGGGRLMFAAYRGPAGAAQWIGSPAQFGVGLGDPSEWKPEIGPKGNPAEIPGAFDLENVPYQDTVPEIQPGKIILSSGDHSIQKTFTLEGDQLNVEINSTQPVSTLIPLTLASQDWAAGSPLSAWRPVPVLDGNRWDWQPDSGSGLTIRFQNAQSVISTTSLDTIQFLGIEENPNLAYPPGHYLTFPTAVIEVQGTEFKVTFSPH